ncbi:amidohydrolase [Sphingobacterium alkalisoli]|uniref:Amidohydrolase n=1 Tax=Sphingobacterium alkalisoli TaxID=1874115 RepID=A0A4U0H5E5_9SPHI|nr:amidohydrolase [Sphingobacterium alkalisoli]TJY66816.1 amidohydrolase [Sphingobacterium alkalisoli]GGH14035.1 amidohydrolase [Sphingobacterium alkalisoli]
MAFINRIFPILLFIAFLSSCTTNTQVDLIVFNAKIYTVDSTFTTAEAFAVKNGIFIDIGTSESILQRYKAKETIDAKGNPIYPGFYDAHAHFFMFSELLDQADLTGATSVAEVIKRLKTYRLSNPEKKWIVGAGWDQNLWPEKTFPTKDSLDKYFPDIPIYLSRIDYHAAWVNSKALEIARLDSTAMVEGGLVIADSIGQPAGILIDNATSLVSIYIPEAAEIDLLKSLRRAQDSLFSVGLTTIVDAGLDPDQLEILTKFYSQDSLKIRDYAMILAKPNDIENYIRKGIYDSERLSIKSVKLMADGALGSRGACLLEHYHDHPSNGFLLRSPAEFDQTIQLLANSPFQVNTHAIGDSANRLILDAYGRHLKDGKSRRWRIEHAQVIAPEDFKKFSEFYIIPSIQPTHATSDMYWAEERLGTERIKGAYAYKQLLQQYGLVALGSDFPVEHFNPLYGFHAAVARVDKTGFPHGGFQMENSLTREEALRGMTIWAAFSCFQEQKRGSIEKGKDADFVILEDDIMTLPDNRLRDVKTKRTVIAGETVFLR